MLLDYFVWYRKLRGGVWGEMCSFGEPTLIAVVKYVRFNSVDEYIDYCKQPEWNPVISREYVRISVCIDSLRKEDKVAYVLKYGYDDLAIRLVRKT